MSNDMTDFQIASGSLSSGIGRERRPTGFGALARSTATRRAAGELSLVSLAKRYVSDHPVTAVDDVSVEIAAGELVTFLGPSGAGKTTVLRIVSGLEYSDDGQVLLDGRDITALPPQRRDMGVVFQDYALFPHMTVRENCAFPLRVRKERRTRIRAAVDEALALVQLDGLADRFPAQLSGGQKQRVAIARTLVYQPRVLLMDEPLGALDKNLREHMQLELRQLQQSLGVTCIYVTHDQDEAMSISDRIAVMRHGRIEQIGSPRELYDKPSSPFVAGFFGRMNFLTGTVTDIGADDLTVDTRLGPLRAARRRTRFANGNLSRDAEVIIGIRPEHVTVGATNSAHDIVSSVELTINQIRYAGSSTYLHAAGRDGETSLLACLPDQPPGIEPGANARFGWPADRTLVFEPDPPA